MTEKLSDERLAELIKLHAFIRDSPNVPTEVYQYRSDEVNALTELAEYRAREAAREYALGRPASMPDMSGKSLWTIVGGPHSNYRMMLKMAKTRPDVKGQPVTILTRCVGPWEAVDGDD